MSHQGLKASDVFSGRGQSEASKLFYNESADLFANIIRKNFQPSQYSLADLGGHKGEFLKELLAKLPEYQFESIIIDQESGLIPELKAEKVVGNIKNTSLPDKSIDLVILRYVLAWDTLEDQKLILAEIARICKGVTIIQHQGADSSNPEPLQKALANLFSGEIPDLKREEGFFTESKQIENWLNELGVNYEKIQERTIEPVSDLFIDKFGLVGDEINLVKNIFKDCDYTNQSTFVLKFN